MKFLTKLSILAGAIFLVSVTVKANNITWGSIGNYDRLLAVDNVFKSSSWFSKQKVVVVYPPKGHINYVILSAINAWDWGGQKDFGNATLIEGGPGHRNSTIYLESQRGKALNFTIHYIGRYIGKSNLKETETTNIN